MNTIIKHIYHLYCAINIYLSEQNKEGVKYIYKNNKSDKLIIIFSGIGSDYNYRRSLQNSSYDQLYIKDTWANGVSYYLYEDGQNNPEQYVSWFINTFLEKHHYSKIITLGSSKGGSAALYFGLKHHADEIYSGACQYLVGNYLGIYHEQQNHNYYKLVMGKIEKEKGIVILNNVFDDMVTKNKGTESIVYLIYSKEEHTYTDDIVFLINKLDECHIQHIDQVEKFPEHSMIGNYMKVICQNNFK